MIVAAKIITLIGGYYIAKPCYILENILGTQGAVLSFYPDCEPYFSGANPNQHVVVEASMNGRGENVGAALNLNFGPALWLSLAIHAIGVEIYVSLITSLLVLAL